METLSDNFRTVVKVVSEPLGKGEAEDYFTTIYAITETQFRIHLVTGDAATGSEMLDMIEGFGFKIGRRRRFPSFIFVAAEAAMSDGTEAVMISGCSANLEVALGYLRFDRFEDGRIRLGQWSGILPVPEDEFVRVPAFRGMRGAIAKSTIPWWRFWS